MRKVTNALATNNYTEVLAVDEPAFGANHIYHVVAGDDPFSKGCRTNIGDVVTVIRFQKGPIKEYGIIGCQNEDLILIALDRLQGFQQTSFACKENEKAIEKLEEALMWLKKRTLDRELRGVEGTHTV